MVSSSIHQVRDGSAGHIKVALHPGVCQRPFCRRPHHSHCPGPCSLCGQSGRSVDAGGVPTPPSHRPSEQRHIQTQVFHPSSIIHLSSIILVVFCAALLESRQRTGLWHRPPEPLECQELWGPTRRHRLHAVSNTTLIWTDEWVTADGQVQTQVTWHILHVSLSVLQTGQ